MPSLHLSSPSLQCLRSEEHQWETLLQDYYGFLFLYTWHNLALLSFHGRLLTTQLERLITFSHTSPLISLLG